MTDFDSTKLKHMDITEMPSDPNGYLGKFRSTLRGTYNSNRNNTEVMLRLKATLEYTLKMIEAATAQPASSSDTQTAPAGSAPSTSSRKRKSKPAERAAQR